MKLANDQCDIRAEVKLRNGYYNWWCFTHCCSARGENGSKMARCFNADIPLISNDEKIYIDLNDYPGGVGIWGSLDAVYDSKRDVSEHGVHVHLRKSENGLKEIDKTYKEVFIKVSNNVLNENEWIKIDHFTACAYTASIIFDKKMKTLRCKHCNREHVDAEFFAVHYHKKHMCTFCGRDFIDSELGISNPVFTIQNVFSKQMEIRKLEKVSRVLKIKQKDYPGGIQIWGSNPAIIWTAKRSEESGIHVHLFKDKHSAPLVDETYGHLEIDGINFDDQMIRYYMVQKSLTYLAKYITSLNCPQCNSEHFDTGDNGLNPHKIHICETCGNIFEDKSKYKGVVSNPILKKLASLKLNI